MNPRDRRRLRLLAIVWIGWILVAPALVTPVAAERPDRVVHVLVFSKSTRTSLVNALGIDTEAIDMTVITNDSLSIMSSPLFDEYLTRADVIFVDRYLPRDPSDLQLLESHVNGSAGRDGLVMFGFLQNGTTPGIGDFTAAQLAVIEPLLPVDIPSAYVNSTANYSSAGYAIGIMPAWFPPHEPKILAECIPWDKCPVINRRVMAPVKPNATRILAGIPGNETLLAERRDGENGSSAIFFSMEITENNVPFTTSIYFNYLMYVCAFHAMANYSDGMIESWEEWPFSPGAGVDTPWVWIVMIVGLFGVMFWLHTKSKKNPPVQGDVPGDDHAMIPDAVESTRRPDEPGKL